jgi:hypothetical protein
MFFNKIKPLKLEAYAPVGDLLDYFPIVKSNKILPNWFKNLPKSINDNNVRNCTGIKDLYNEGFMIPSWGEYFISVQPNRQVQVESPVQLQYGHSSRHDLEVEAPGAWPNYVNIKLHNPWWFWCNEPVKWVLIQPVWNQEEPGEWTVIPGVTEFRYNNQANINTIFRVMETEYTTKINTGEELVQMIPITERPVELELKVLTDTIYNEKFANWSHSFKFGYQKIRTMFEKRK